MAKKTAHAGAISGEELLKRLRDVESLAAQKGNSLRDALTRSQVSNVILLLSAQHLRLKRLVQWIREHLSPETPGGPSGAGIYFGTELASAQHTEHIVSSLCSASLFSQRELVVIYDAEKIKAGAQQAIATAIGKQTDSSLLILCAAAPPARGALATALTGRATTVELQPLTGTALDRWIDREVARIGIASGLQKDARALLVQRFGDDVTQLSHELEKLSLLTANGAAIERSLVESLSHRRAERTSFELVRQIGMKNRIGVIGTAHDLVIQGLHPLQIVAFLSRAWRTLLGKAAPGAGPLPGDLTNPWFLKQLGSMSGNFSIPRLVAGVTTLAALDFRLKDSKLPATAALETALLKLCEEPGSASSRGSSAPLAW